MVVHAAVASGALLMPRAFLGWPVWKPFLNLRETSFRYRMRPEPVVFLRLAFSPQLTVRDNVSTSATSSLPYSSPPDGVGSVVHRKNRCGDSTSNSGREGNHGG